MRPVAAPSALDWDALLDDAILGDRLTLSFQPVVDIQAGRITGYETLARFRGAPDVGPEGWFAAARRSGRAAELDAAVVARALAWWRNIPSNCFLTINVEPTSLPTAELAHLLGNEHRLDGLVIEVTEHVSVTAGPGVFDALERYRTMGALVAVDDAGSGYSGLQQILDLRPDFLKLDRSLVAGIDLDEAKL
ncbi:MAG: EAL domain-containing protein, partial [Acidimicrobiia bacterium]|nr:EAL domain-containing protein [Acidimicrobiia bacterium]